MKDIIVIGSGIVGSSIARELSRYSVNVVVLEKGNDVSVGTTKANSGIVHGGFDAKSGTNKAKFNIAGNPMFDKLSEELQFPFIRNGSLVLCFDENQAGALEDLYNKGVANGVEGLEIISGEKVRELEPNISINVHSALLAKTGGIVSPYEMNIAYAENAYNNGVEFQFLKEVIEIEKNEEIFSVKCSDGSVLQSKIVINCAGVFSDEINNLVCEEKLHIIPRKGDYILLDKVHGDLCTHTLFQLPTKMGKGVLVTPTTHGNILLGPTAVDVDSKISLSTKRNELDSIYESAQNTVPSISKRMIITAFSGIRAHSIGDDFVVGESKVKAFYNLAGIESPGLTSAPALAVHIANEISTKYELNKNEKFVATRDAIPHFAVMDNAKRLECIAKNPLYGNIVCRCEMITEGEIVDSIKRPLGAKDLDGIKRRTRAGMGRCQAGFCTSRVMEILSRELEISMLEVTKSGVNSEMLLGRTK